MVSMATKALESMAGPTVEFLLMEGLESYTM